MLLCASPGGDIMAKEAFEFSLLLSEVSLNPSPVLKGIIYIMVVYV